MNFKKLTLALTSAILLSLSIFPVSATNLNLDHQAHQEQPPSQESAQFELSDIDLLAVNPCFKGKEDLSPLCGLLISKSRILSNSRFHAMYGAPDPSSPYLTHPAITHPHGEHTPTIDWDSPLDFTSSLLQQFFPSPAGGTLLVPGSQNDLFRVMPVELIAALAKLYTHEKKRYIQDTNINPFPSFKSFFDDCFENWNHRYIKGSKQKAGKEEKWSLTQGECVLIDAQWKNQLADPAHTYATLFTNAMAESELYPKNLVESALLTLLWKRLNLADIAPRSKEAFLDSVMTLCNEQSWKDTSLPLEFSKNYYLTWKTNQVNELDQLKAETVERLFKNPQDLVYLTLLFNCYNQPTSLESEIQKEEKGFSHVAAELFKACFDRIIEGAGVKKIKKLISDWKKNASEFVDYQKFFSQASTASVAYPKERLDSILLTLAQRKMCHEGVAKKTSSNFTISLCHDKIQELALNPARFTKDLYMTWKIESLDDKGYLKPEALDALLKKPEDLVFMTLMYDVYDNPFPQILGTGSANYTYTDPKGSQQVINFSDCGEASSLSFLNTTIGNFRSRSFEIELLSKFFPNASPKLIQFYKLIQPVFEKINDGIIGRSHWAHVVSGLNAPDDVDPIIYCTEDAQCEIKGVGLDNMLRVLGKLLGEPFTQMFSDETDPDKRRGKIFTYLLQKLSFMEDQDLSSESNASGSEDSDDEVGLTWYVKEKDSDEKIKDSLPNFTDVIIQRDGQDLFKWHFGDGHFRFERAFAQQEVDWRHMSKEMIQKVIESDLPKVLKSHLLPFYVNIDEFSYRENSPWLRPEIIKKNEALLPYLYEQGYLKEVLFGANFGGAEQKMSIMDQIISVAPKEYKPLFMNWIKKMPDDRAINLELTSFLYKNRHYFTSEIMDMLGQSVQNRIKETMFILENKMTCQQFENLYQGFYSHDLLGYLYESLNPLVLKDLAQSRNSEGETPLHIASSRPIGGNWAKKLLDHGADLNATNIDGETPLSRSLRCNCHDNVYLLLTHDQIDPMTFQKLIAQERGTILYGDIGNFLNFSIRENHFDFIETLLKNYKLDPNRMDDYNVSLFSSAVSQGSLRMINLFLEDERTDPNILPGGWPFQTPLLNSLSQGRFDIAERLLQDKRVDPNIPDSNGNTPLTFCSNIENLDFFLKLCNHPKIDLNIPNGNGNSPLSLTSVYGHWEMAEILLNFPQVDPNVKWAGDTLLIGSLKRRNPDFAFKVCNHPKIDPTIPDDKGNFPLALACGYGDWKVAERLLNLPQVDPNVKLSFYYGNTPLIQALQTGKLEFAFNLCKHPKIDLNLTNDQGESPLLVACKYHLWDFVEGLLNKPSVNRKVKDLNGNTPYTVAVRNYKFDIADKLQEF